MHPGNWFVRRAARAAALAGAVLLSGRVVAAQETTPFDVKVAPVTATQGDMGEAVITLSIHQNYRLIAEPPPNKYSTTLMVTFDASRPLQPRLAILPEGKVFKETQGDKAQDWSYSAYEGTIVVKMPFKVTDEAPVGDHTMHGRIRFQALMLDENGLAGFLKTAVKVLDVPVHVTPRRK